MGLAIEDHKIQSENQNLQISSRTAGAEHGNELTLRDLAAMEAGYYWDEDYRNPFYKILEFITVKNMAEALLKSSPISPQTWKQIEYQSGATIIRFAIRKAVNIPLSAYVSQNFEPLGMESDAYWNIDEDNKMEKRSVASMLFPRDYAKLGQLMSKKEIGTENN